MFNCDISRQAVVVKQAERALMKTHWSMLCDQTVYQLGPNEKSTAESSEQMRFLLIHWPIAVTQSLNNTASSALSPSRTSRHAVILNQAGREPCDKDSLKYAVLVAVDLHDMIHQGPQFQLKIFFSVELKKKSHLHLDVMRMSNDRSMILDVFNVFYFPWSRKTCSLNSLW